MKTEFADCVAPAIRLPFTTLGETEAVLMETWTIRRVGDFFDIEVPEGTTTDGATIPRLLWRLWGHPMQAPRVYAATVHDYIYRNAWRLCITRKEADEIYYQLLRHFGISAFKAGVEYYALRAFGGKNYIDKPPKDAISGECRERGENVSKVG